MRVESATNSSLVFFPRTQASTSRRRSTTHRVKRGFLSKLVYLSLSLLHPLKTKRHKEESLDRHGGAVHADENK